LSTATTSSPRASNARHRCEPRNPAPPVTTSRLIAWSPASHAVVAEAAASHPGGIEEVAGVDDRRVAHLHLDPFEIERPEFVPLGQQRDDIDSGDRVVRI